VHPHVNSQIEPCIDRTWLKGKQPYTSMKMTSYKDIIEARQSMNKVCTNLTCFRETGKVIFPENSGLLTISLHISLQALHTEAQATTCLRAGHVLSLASNLLITSRSNSGGRPAQGLSWMTTGWSSNSHAEPWDFPLKWPGSLTSKLRLDKLPNPSLMSRTILRNDIFSNTLAAPS